MYLYSLYKCSVHQYESIDSLEIEARTDVNFITAVAVEDIANSLPVFIAPLSEVTTCRAQPVEGITSVHLQPPHTETSHMSLQNQNS